MKEQALLALQGPRAAEVLETIIPGVSELSFMEGGPFQLAGRTACGSADRATRARTGSRSRCRRRAAAALADAIAAHELAKPIGLGARDSLRLEAGLPLYGHDLDTRTTPVMAGLTFAINKRRRAEGGFPGAMRILAELKMGPLEQRVGLDVDGRQPVREGALDPRRRRQRGRQDHQRRLFAFAAAPDRNGLCCKPSRRGPARRVKLEQRGKLFDARVVPMPFVPHRYHRKGAA